jgi:aspartate 1-decarboxylase
VVQVNGAGAHLIQPGNVVIIATFTELRSKDARKHAPELVFVDGQNRPRTEDAEVVAEGANGKKK